MTNLDNLCEYFIWWPDKDKGDPSKQVCPNWAPSGRFVFDDEDDENNKIYIRLCPEHLTEIQQRSKPRPKPEPGKEKYYRVRRFTVDQDMNDTEKGEIVKEGYDYRGDGYINEAFSLELDEKEKGKYRYFIEEVPDQDLA